jgi:hypothetical protein
MPVDGDGDHGIDLRDAHARGLQPEYNEIEQLSVRAAGSKRHLDAACRLREAARNLQQVQADSSEFGILQGVP